MRNLLVTGGAGFIGSNFVTYLLRQSKDIHIVNLDLLTYAGSLDNLTSVIKDPRHEFVKGDICDRPLVEDLFRKHDFDGIVHFAAESHVDNSIAGPEAFMRTNVMGTFVVLDVARRAWLTAPFEPRAGMESRRMLHVSTDEVYGSLGPTGLFSERTPYSPNSPYSASKASSDLLVKSYFHTFGMNVVLTNCSNNYGPAQHDEKLIPTIIRNALAGKDIPVYGDGTNIRDWLYVLDHCKAVHAVLQKGRAGETYNVGGQNEQTNNEIVRIICEILDRKHPLGGGRSYKAQIKFVKDRAGHDKRYAIDSTKIKTEIGWKPEVGFEAGLESVVDWYALRYRHLSASARA